MTGGRIRMLETSGPGRCVRAETGPLFGGT